MCLVLIAWRVHGEFPCIVAANRDEFHARPALRAQWWLDRPHLFAGRDLCAGGTWLGMTRSGRVAALTNFRGPQIRGVDVPSRGALVTDVLDANTGVDEGLMRLRSVHAGYNPFNVVFSDGRQLGVYESTVDRARELGPGIYGLSNDLLDTPWPKVERAKAKFSGEALDLGNEQSLLALLRDDRQAPDAALPDTGVGLEWERMLSSAFITGKDYGTRCTTIIRVDRTGHASFDEWSWDAGGGEIGRVGVKFRIG